MYFENNRANKLQEIAKIIGIPSFVIAVFISINTIISYILIYLFSLSFIVAIISLLASLSITILVLIYLVVDIVYDVKALKKNLTIYIIPFSMFALVSFLISLYLFKHTLQIWDQSNNLSLALYIIIQGNIPQNAPASIDPAFYPIGSAILLSTFLAIVLGEASYIKTYDALTISKYILPRTINTLVKLNAVFIFILTFSIMMITLSLSLFYAFRLGIKKRIYKNEQTFRLLYIVFSSLLVISGMGYILIYPINTNSFCGALMFLALVFLYTMYDINVPRTLLGSLLFFSTLSFHYTFFAQMFLFLILLTIHKILTTPRQNKYSFIPYIFIILIIATIVVSMFIFTNIGLFSVFGAHNNAYLEPWKYLRLKQVPYLEVEPGLFGKVFDVDLYIKYKILPYTRFLIDRFLLKTEYTGIIFYILAFMGFINYIKEYKSIYRGYIMLLFSCSIALVFVTPLLWFTRLYISIRILSTIYSITGLFLFLTNSFSFSSHKLKNIINFLSSTILLLMTIFIFLYISSPPIPPSDTLIDINDIYNISVKLTKISNGRALFPATPESRVLWALFPDRVLGSDPRHIMVHTRIYTSIIFDKYYTSVGPYDFTRIPIRLKKDIINKYHIVLIFQRQSMVLSNETASNLGFVYVEDIGKYKVWILRGDK